MPAIGGCVLRLDCVLDVVGQQRQQVVARQRFDRVDCRLDVSSCVPDAGMIRHDDRDHLEVAIMNVR